MTRKPTTKTDKPSDPEESVERMDMVSFTIELPEPLFRTLQRMQKTGLWGPTVPDVCVTLISAGIVDLIAKGVLPRPEALNA